MWLLGAVAGQASSAYSRLQFLLSSLERQVPVPPGKYNVVYEHALHSYYDVDPQDGRAESSCDYAQAGPHGLIVIRSGRAQAFPISGHIQDGRRAHSARQRDARHRSRAGLANQDA